MTVFTSRVYIVILAACLIFQAEAFNIQCSNEIWNWEGEEAKECQVEFINVVTANQTITSVDGKTESNGDHQRTVSIFINSQVVHFLPHQLQKFFPALQEISIIKSKLQSISKADLQPFKSLKILSLFDNELERLDGDLFEFNSELQHIDLKNNKLKFIGQNVMKPMTNLKYADFRNNICIDDKAESHNEIANLAVVMENQCKATSNQSTSISGLKDVTVLTALLMLVMNL